MIDWTASMEQTFEYYTVNPITWKDVKRLDNVTACSITRDSTVDTLGSATIDITESVGESYIRIYLIVIQNGVNYKLPLGTFLIQTPSSKFDGKTRSVSMDAYTPLIELKENRPPIGYYIPKRDMVMKWVSDLAKEWLRAPVTGAFSDTKLTYDFVADPNETWMTFLSDLALNAKFTFDLDELGRVFFSPKRDTASLQPVWTYTDDNSSILYPELTINHDIYGIPNVVEVIASTTEGCFSHTVTNDDPNSPTSTVNRGRKITDRITNPDILGTVNQERIEEYAKQRLRDLSTVEYTISYTHAYCPARVGDCVRLNYTRAGLTNIKARVISQSIKCEPGCPVTEKAVFTKKLWG